MIFLENLYIQNYKNLKSLTLKNFGDLNIFIGPNNSGKTSILNSINFLQNIDVLKDSSFPCKWCEGLNEGEKYKFENLEIFSVGCNINYNDQYLRENKVSIMYEYSKETFDDIFSPYLGQISKQIEYFAGKLVSDKENIDTGIDKLIIDGVLKDLQSSLDLSEENRKKIDHLFHSYISNRDIKRDKRILNDNTPKTAILLFSNAYNEKNEKLINEIVNVFNDIVKNFTTQNMNHYFLDSIRFKTIIKYAKNEYFLNHIIKDSGINCDPLYTLILKQRLEATPNSETLYLLPTSPFFVFRKLANL